ncbi:MAG: hypothetical protein JHD16_16375 [Solirubrobacteraceae bacterium]|nr:hypothetical protein [Solirubrobacteraceae bacterium]
MSELQATLESLDEQLADDALAGELRWTEHTLRFHRHTREVRAYVHAEIDARGRGYRTPSDATVRSFLELLEGQELDEVPR